MQSLDISTTGNKTINNIFSDSNKNTHVYANLKRQTYPHDDGHLIVVSRKLRVTLNWQQLVTYGYICGQPFCRKYKQTVFVTGDLGGSITRSVGGRRDFRCTPINDPAGVIEHVHIKSGQNRFGTDF